jgi:hypothetical protein
MPWADAPAFARSERLPHNLADRPIPTSAGRCILYSIPPVASGHVSSPHGLPLAPSGLDDAIIQSHTIRISEWLET